MKVQRKFYVQFRLANKFILQYETRSKSGANLWPFLKKGDLLKDHTDKFTVTISPRGLIVKTFHGYHLSEVMRVDNEFDHSQMRLDMTFFLLSTFSGPAFWNFQIDSAMPVKKDSKTFYLEQMVYNAQGQRVGQTEKQARLISKDKLVNKPSRIMSTVRDFRGYDQED